jgi:gamma-glutamylcyclotransferase (GGCT)/AIG2-like uncharacterized protein YtfP
MKSLFAYGTLLFSPVLRAVVGRTLDSRPATLHGYVRRRVVGEIFPAIVEWEADESVAGVIYLDLDDDAWRRLDRFEGELYSRRSVLVRCGGSEQPASTYVLDPAFHDRLGPEPWDVDSFASEHLESFVARLGRMRDPRAVR